MSNWIPARVSMEAKIAIDCAPRSFSLTIVSRIGAHLFSHALLLHLPGPCYCQNIEGSFFLAFVAGIRCVWPAEGPS
jgi:hypothetical protein